MASCYSCGRKLSDDEQKRYDELTAAIDAAGYDIWAVSCGGTPLGGVLVHRGEDKRVSRFLDGIWVSDAAQDVIAGTLTVEVYLRKLDAARAAAAGPVPDPLAGGHMAERLEQFLSRLSAAGYVPSSPGRDGSRSLFIAGQTCDYFDEETETTHKLPVFASGGLRHAEVFAFAQGDEGPLEKAIRRVQCGDRLKELSRTFRDANYQIHLSDSFFTAYEMRSREAEAGMKMWDGLGGGIVLSTESIFDYLETGMPTAVDLLQGVEKRRADAPF